MAPRLVFVPWIAALAACEGPQVTAGEASGSDLRTPGRPRDAASAHDLGEPSPGPGAADLAGGGSQSSCGDGVCDTGERCDTCLDCACAGNEVCTAGACTQAGNGSCDPGEDCGNSPDCACGGGEVCAGGICTKCGNGVCDPGERCDDCRDCACQGDQICSAGACTDHGNQVCDPGENCDNSPDCACQPGQLCRQGACTTCGNGRCDVNEGCNSCPGDCGCGGGLVCKNDQCQPPCASEHFNYLDVAVNLPLYSVACGLVVTEYASLIACDKNKSCAWAIGTGSSLFEDLAWGDTDTLTYQCCYMDFLSCNNGVHNGWCTVQGKQVACNCTAPKTVFVKADTCPSENVVLCQ